MKPIAVLVTGPPVTGKSTVAEHIAALIAAPVLGWDWMMAALTSFPSLGDALAGMEVDEYRRVGWSLLRNAALAQVRRGRSVVLDGVAREVELVATRSVVEAHAPVVVVATCCSDRELHRQRIIRRRRDIPGWDELDWDHVEAHLSEWVPPAGADLHLDTSSSLETNIVMVTELLERARDLPGRSGEEARATP
jgi:predicted kinase